MSDNSAISWCDATLNALHGCDRVSAGCLHCYAIPLSHRMASHPAETVRSMFAGTTKTHANGQLDWTGLFNFTWRKLLEPIAWKRPRRIFTNSLSDMFHPGVSIDWVAAHWALFALTPRHTYQVLTKRPERIREVLGDPSFPALMDAWLERFWNTNPRANMKSAVITEYMRPLEYPLPNVWLGTSCENQATADERIPLLVETPAAIRFLSCEPLLGPIDLSKWLWDLHYSVAIEDGAESFDAKPSETIDWVISGGESGRQFRTAEPTWFRSLRDQCVEADVPYFHKQGSHRRSGQDYRIDGVTWHQFPAASS